MKTKLSYAALATTASVALLAGISGANAQVGPNGVQYCSTTQIFPGHNNCVMPSASAPGGGSFPGSFLVPGTNTSFAVHGFIQFDVTHDLGQHVGDTGFNQYTVPLEGNGIAAALGHAANGGTTMSLKATRPDIETRTPTGYGELKTYIEFDFNQTPAVQIGGNNDVLRLRQAYGTLGPWLMGQTLSLFADPQAYADTAQGNQDAGMMNTLDVRKPQIRYTWLAGNGLSFSGSAEEPMGTNNAAPGVNTIFSDATNGAALGSAAGALNGTTVYYNWPKFVAAAELDQPWGHVKLAGTGGVQETDTARTSSFTASQRHQFAGYAFTLSGHLNTFGKDALRGGVVYDHGAPDFLPGMIDGGRIYNDGTGAHATVNAWAAYVSYEHFFTGQWRANAAAGYDHEGSNNPGFTSATTLASIDRSHLTSELNVIYSPVPQTDFILEWQHAHRKVLSGANGTLNRVDAQFKFYF